MAGPPEDHADEQLLNRLTAGDSDALSDLFARYQPAVRRMVELRLDQNVRARVDVSDVLQETQIEVSQRLDDFVQRRPMPLGLWVRKTAYQCLLRLRRHHVAQLRSVSNEVRLPDRSSVVLARQLLAGHTPSQEMMNAELLADLESAVAGLHDDDREIVLLRNFENMTNQEAATLLGINPDAASKRYTRALLKLRKSLQDHQM